MIALRNLTLLLDRHPMLALPLWTIVFLAVMVPVGARPLLSDELTTYYIAMSPSIAHFVECMQQVDLQPPLNFLLVRLSVGLFGDSALSVRLPSLVAFLVASSIVFHLAAKRLGGLFGLVALGVIWCLWHVPFAVEARPYALLLALLSLALLCWLNAIETESWSIWHTGLGLSMAALFLSHCFAPAFGAAIGVGEMVRTAQRRRIDRKIWLAILSPLLVLPLYIPLLRNAQSIHFPPVYSVKWSTLPIFYLMLVLAVLPVLGTVLIYLLIPKARHVARKWREVGSLHELGFCIATLTGTVCVVGYCAMSDVAFFFRYGIGAVLGATFLLVTLFARLIWDRGCVLAVAILLLGMFVWNKGRTGVAMERFQGVSTAYRGIGNGLPFVVANGLTFVEMDRREPQELLGRLFYLTNEKAALHYIRANMFEGLIKVQRLFPIRARVVDYDGFVSDHPRFLVFAMPDDPENWLLSKLKDDGAEIRLLQEASQTGYLDRRVYEVRVQVRPGASGI